MEMTGSSLPCGAPQDLHKGILHNRRSFFDSSMIISVSFDREKNRMAFSSHLPHDVSCEENRMAFSSHSQQDVSCATGGCYYFVNFVATRGTCIRCLEKELEMWESGHKRRARGADSEPAVQQSLNFLRLPFENELASRTHDRGGDVQIVVQARTDERLRAHKFVLVRNTHTFC